MTTLAHSKQADMFYERSWDFIGAIDRSDFTATTTGAGSAGSGPNVFPGVHRLTTDANDNDRVEVNLTASVLNLVKGTHAFKFLWTSPSEVDNADFAVGLSTLDTDVIGDSATATELLLLRVVDADAASGSRTLTLLLKNGSGTENWDTGFVVEASTNYCTELIVTVDSAGVGHVSVLHHKVNSGAFFTTNDSTEGTKPYSVSYLPTGQIAIFYGLQNGSAAARTMDIDKVTIKGPRYAQ